MCSGFHLLTPGVGFLHAARSRERKGGRRGGGGEGWEGAREDGEGIMPGNSHFFLMMPISKTYICSK